MDYSIALFWNYKGHNVSNCLKLQSPVWDARNFSIHQITDALNSRLSLNIFIYLLINFNSFVSLNPFACDWIHFSYIHTFPLLVFLNLRLNKKKNLFSRIYVYEPHSIFSNSDFSWFLPKPKKKLRSVPIVDISIDSTIIYNSDDEILQDHLTNFCIHPLWVFKKRSI